MRLLGLLLLAVGGCVRPPEQEPALSWRLIDSTWVAPWDELTDSLAVYRAVVTRGAVLDTLSNVIGPWPVVTDASTIWGVRVRREDASRELFRWRAGDGNVAAWNLPGEVLYNFHDLAVSPRGEYLAYVGRDSTFGLYGIVQRLPAGPAILRGPRAAGCDCDVDLNHARWVTPDSFEIAVNSSADERGWMVVAGRASLRRLATHFVAEEPDWHAAPAP